MPSCLMVTVISLLPAIICNTLLCTCTCVLGRESEREKRDGGNRGGKLGSGGH